MIDHSADNQKNLIPSFIFGVLFAGILFVALGALKGWWFQETGNNILSIIFVLLCIGVVALIFLMANIALTIVSVKQNAPALAYMFIWGPSVLVLFGFGVWQAFAEKKQANFEQAHPNISELHINLSGKHLWLDTGYSEPQPLLPDQFLENTRYVSNGLEKMAEYDGAHLAKSLKNMSIFTSETGELENKTVLTLPVIQPSAYPDVASFIPLIKAQNTYGYVPTEASLWVYQYYYYADHIEVVPAINLSGSDSMALWGSDLPVVNLHIVNLLPKALVRVEVDGATLALGNDPWPVENNPNECSHRNYANYVINTFNKPVKVRWQLAEPNPQWHEALLTVPTLPALKNNRNWRKREDNVFIYFQNNGTLAAQWQQNLTTTGDKLGIRTSAIAPALISPAPCGNAQDSWDASVTRVEN